MGEGGIKYFWLKIDPKKRFLLYHTAFSLTGKLLKGIWPDHFWIHPSKWRFKFLSFISHYPVIVMCNGCCIEILQAKCIFALLFSTSCQIPLIIKAYFQSEYFLSEIWKHTCTTMHIFLFTHYLISQYEMYCQNNAFSIAWILYRSSVKHHGKYPEYSFLWCFTSYHRGFQTFFLATQISASKSYATHNRKKTPF